MRRLHHNERANRFFMYNSAVWDLKKKQPFTAHEARGEIERVYQELLKKLEALEQKRSFDDQPRKDKSMTYHA